MSQLKDLPYALLQFYATSAYPCSYLPARQARSQVATPSHLIDTPLYSELVRSGFRRSGVFTYRPHCDTCRACIPVRLPVASFQPNRSQRRVLRQHANLQARELPLAFFEEHFTLYRAYQAARHSGGGMDGDGREQYVQFLLQSQVDSRLIEFRDEHKLVMVMIIDCLDNGLSSVYTFFDASSPHTSYGSYGILWQIEACRRLQQSYLYLGYWIRDAQKMRYKRAFKPLEGCIEGRWRTLSEADFDKLDGSYPNQPTDAPPEHC